MPEAKLSARQGVFCILGSAPCPRPHQPICDWDFFTHPVLALGTFLLQEKGLLPPSVFWLLLPLLHASVPPRPRVHCQLSLRSTTGWVASTRHLLSCRSGGWESKVKGLAGGFFGGLSSSPCLTWSVHAHACVLISCSYQDTRYNTLGCTLMTSSKTLFPNTVPV